MLYSLPCSDLHQLDGPLSQCFAVRTKAFNGALIALLGISKPIYTPQNNLRTSTINCYIDPFYKERTLKSILRTNLKFSDILRP